MPPKVKKGGKKKKKTTISIDDVDTTILNRTKLEEFCINVNRELIQEKQYSDFLMLERDKLVTMIALSMEHLRVLRGKNREIRREIRDAEDEHRITMSHNRQKVIHLKNDLENKVLGLKTGTNTIISDERENHDKLATEIIFDINELKKQTLQVEIDFHTNKDKITKQHTENISMVREKGKNTHILFEIKREKVMKEQSKQLQLICSANYNSLILLKEKDYQMFLNLNKKRTDHLKHYYNRIVEQNQKLMHHMKNEVLKAKESLGKLDKQHFHLKEENKKLAEELHLLDEEKYILREKLALSEQSQFELKETKEELKSRKKYLQNLKIENDVLDMIDEKREAIQREEDILGLKILLQLLSKIQGINLVNELFVLHISNKLCEINATLNEVKGIYEKKGKSSMYLELVDEYFNNSLDSINYDITEIGQKRNDLFRAYRKILKKLNIPFENTGFKPLRFEEVLAKIDNPCMSVNENNLFISPQLLIKISSYK